VTVDRLATGRAFHDMVLGPTGTIAQPHRLRHVSVCEIA
jgi:hypothetical protein